ncbi:ABC transporter substrate-binding protein [Nonomuraea sp. NPDC050310]|uniref:ABC transporter substrate-binding protein n=1 Tax=unclassified Nonomuraea TaxID=2593643 RepID=UPI0033FF10F8
MALAAAGTTLALALAACGGGSTGTESSPGATGSPGGASQPAAAAEDKFNAGIDNVFNPSDAKGGTLKMAVSEDWDSIDPGDTYYGMSWNLSRIYARPLVTYKPAPGKQGQELVPDLAEALGVPSDDAKTWTYKLRAGLKFEDGTPITSKDVKYAVLRSLDKTVLVNGPTYFNDFLDLPKDFKSVYKTPDVKTDQAIETPDDQTIIFHLKKAFGGFDYFAALPATAPVPQAKDTGAKYREHPIASGPYMFETVEAGKQYVLVRNPNWDQATDPIRKALPDRYEISLGVNADDLDNRLISGDLHVDVAGTGLQPAALGRVAGDEALKARTDNPTATRTWYTSIIPDVPPFDNVECRKAVLFAADRDALQNAYGGAIGGEIATSLMPPGLAGWKKIELYPTSGSGDVEKAKAALAACGKPEGFETNISYRADRPKEKATAEAIQQALAKVGIKVNPKGYPTGDYFRLYAGKPDFVKKNGIGLAVNGWGADWNTGFGFMSQIVDSRTIRESGGNYNLSIKDKEIDGLIDQSLGETDANKVAEYWAKIDQIVMERAYVLPGVYSKGLPMRGKGVTNVFVSGAWDMYDYLNMGVQQ